MIRPPLATPVPVRLCLPCGRAGKLSAAGIKNAWLLHG